MSTRVLVTGGLGYLGGRIVQHLRGVVGWQVIATSRQSASAGDLNSLLLPLPCGTAQLDATVHGCDAVVHLAAMNEIRCARYPRKALLVNGLGTLQVLEAAIRAGARRFVYVSTAHVYGKALCGRVSEATLPRPVHPYAISHHVAEDFVLAAHSAGKIEGVVLRLSNGIGAPAHAGVDRWTLVGNDLCRQAVASGRVRLRSSGLQWRDFIPLSSVCAAVAHALRLRSPALADGLFNLGGGRSMRIIDIARKVRECAQVILGEEVRLEILSQASGEDALPLDFRCDKFRSTGFDGRGDLDEEIYRTLRLCMQRVGVRG